MSDKTDATTTVGGVSGERLKSYIERIERLEEEKNGIADDITDIYTESKGFGFEPKIIRQIVRLRKMEADARAEADALLETYRAAVGV